MDVDVCTCRRACRIDRFLLISSISDDKSQSCLIIGIEEQFLAGIPVQCSESVSQFDDEFH